MKLILNGCDVVASSQQVHFKVVEVIFKVAIICDYSAISESLAVYYASLAIIRVIRVTVEERADIIFFDKQRTFKVICFVKSYCSVEEVDAGLRIVEFKFDTVMNRIGCIEKIQEGVFVPLPYKKYVIDNFFPKFWFWLTRVAGH